MKRLFISIVLAGALLAGCNGSSNSNHSSTTPPPPPPPPPTTTSFASYVITLLGQAENSLPAQVNDVMLSFPDDNNAAAFNSVFNTP